MNALARGRTILQALMPGAGGGAVAPVQAPVAAAARADAVAQRPNFVLDRVSLVGRERGRKVQIFDGLSAVFPRGHNIVVLADGKMGAESLVRLMTGMERPKSGRISRNARMSWPMRFSGYMLSDCTMRENVLFLARLYGEDIQQVATFVRDLMEAGPEFDKNVGQLPQETKKKLAAALVLAIDFDCYILDGSLAVRDEAFLDRWERVLAARLKISDVIQVTTRRRGLLDCHEMGAILKDGTLRFYATVAAALDQFIESGEEMSSIDDFETELPAAEPEGENML